MPRASRIALGITTRPARSTETSSAIALHYAMMPLKCLDGRIPFQWSVVGPETQADACRALDTGRRGGPDLLRQAHQGGGAARLPVDVRRRSLPDAGAAGSAPQTSPADP